MLSNKEIVCPNNLLDVAHKKKVVKAGIVNAGKPLPMLSVQDAVNENLIEPIFIGDEKEILKCAEDLKWDISNFEIIHEPIENNTAAIAAVLFSTGSLIISYLEISHFKSSAHFNISFLSPIKIGSIKFSFTASWTDNIGKGLPALTIPALTLFFL